MRILILQAFLLLSLPSVASKKKDCRNIEDVADKALKAQREMHTRRVSPELREHIKAVYNRGIPLNPEFFKYLSSRKAFKPKGFASKDSLVYHAKKHGHEFSSVHYQKQYFKKASAFARSYDENILTFKGKLDIYRFNPLTKEFLVFSSKNSLIGTYYRPSLKFINEERKKQNRKPFRDLTEWFINDKWAAYYDVPLYKQ